MVSAREATRDEAVELAGNVGALMNFLESRDMTKGEAVETLCASIQALHLLNPVSREDIEILLRSVLAEMGRVRLMKVGQ